MVHLHSSILSPKDIKPNSKSKICFRDSYTESHPQHQVPNLNPPQLQNKIPSWNAQHSFPSALENTTIFVAWHLFQEYQPWTENICSVKTVSFAQWRPKVLTSLSFDKGLALTFTTWQAFKSLLRHSYLLRKKKIKKSLLY